MSQAPTILPALLPQLDPQAALQMRVGREGDGFDAVAALFGLWPEGSGDPAAPPALAGDGHPALADRNAPAPLAWSTRGTSQDAAVANTASLTGTVRFVPRLHGGASGSMPASASDAGWHALAGLRSFDGAGDEASGRSAHVGADARPLTGASITRESGIGNGATASGLASDGALSSGLAPSSRSTPELFDNQRFVPETTRTPALVNTDPGRIDAMGAQLAESSSVARFPSEPPGSGDLGRLFNEGGPGRAADTVLREIGPQPAEQTAQRTDGARASSTADVSPTALRIETGLQAPGPANQSASGSSTAPNPAAASAAGQTFDHVALMVRKGVNEARLQLKPPELGQVDVRIEIDGNEARVQLNAQQSQVREALEQLLPRLREALAGQGVELTDASVDDSGRQAGRDDERSERSSDGRLEGQAADTGLDEDPEGSRDSARPSNGLIDAYA